MSNTTFSAKRGLAFALLAGFHALLFYFAVLLPDPLPGAIAFFSWMPWLPLAWLGLPVIVAPAMPIPNVAGDLWCIAIWAVLYWWFAGVIARWLSRSSTGPTAAP